MAAFNKYENFVEDLASGAHQFQAAGHTLKIALSNTQPVAATHETLSQAAEISGGNGYTAGGADTQNDISRSGGTLSVTAVDVVWTATGAVGPFRYVILYNDSQTSPADPLIGWWDYGSSIQLADTETFTVDFGTSMFTLA